MSPDAQRIAIAEACGFKRIPTPFKVGREIVDWPIWEYKGQRYSFHGFPLPDYLNDLNAMSHAEHTSGIGFEPVRYVTELRKVVAQEIGRGFLLFAKAAQRAEAFLRTLGLWKETP
jgi:hypothetical protein